MTSLAPILEPDADAMLRHLQAVFGGAGDGLVELAWTDSETRRLAHAQMFETDRLQDVAKRAAVAAAWLRPSSFRCTPGVQPASRPCTQSLAPCRINSSKVKIAPPWHVYAHQI